MNIHFLSASPEDTIALGERLGRLLKGFELVLLCGDLGAGKTLFTKGLSQALDFPSAEVNSPTFTLMNMYEGKFPIYHFDLYRLGGEEKLELADLDEYLGEGIVVVEWAQYLKESYFSLPMAVEVHFKPAKRKNHRDIAIHTVIEFPNCFPDGLVIS